MNKGSKSFANWSVGCISVAFMISLIVAGILVHFVVRDLTATYTGVGLNPFQPRPADSTEASGDSEATPTLIRLESVPQPWDGTSRVTLLIMGIDYRDWIAGEGSPRSDTMMLVSVDPITLKASMLSIPRDLWVEIPGFTYNRINTAYMLGEAYSLPGGGSGLAMQAVENLIGVPIQYYAVVDFYTFERLVDEIGGIDILVHEPMWISPIDSDSIWVEAKPYHFSGAEALAYARVRYVGGGDFGRAQRQQQVILAIMDRVVGADMLPTLINRAPVIYQEVSSGVRTNLTLEQIISLAWLALKIPSDQVQSGVISPPSMVGFYTRPDGAQVLRFVPDQIRILRNQLFVDTSALGPEIFVLPEEGDTP
jgi:LCP family protein required for cell wall assembly